MLWEAIYMFTTYENLKTHFILWKTEKPLSDMAEISHTKNIVLAPEAVHLPLTRLKMFGYVRNPFPENHCCYLLQLVSVWNLLFVTTDNVIGFIPIVYLFCILRVWLYLLQGNSCCMRHTLSVKFFTVIYTIREMDLAHKLVYHAKLCLVFCEKSP